jgi:hypothetical protein
MYPDDHRPRQAIEARRGWLLGSVSNEELSAESAESAAESAARSAQVNWILEDCQPTFADVLESLPTHEDPCNLGHK